MPTLSEFVLTIGLRYDEAEDTTFTCFRFETLRQFKSFRYQIEVTDEHDPTLKNLTFSLKGVLAPSQMLSSSGPAATELCYPALEGDYRIHIAGAKQKGDFVIRGSKQKIRLVEELDEDFVRIQINDQIEVIRA